MMGYPSIANDSLAFTPIFVVPNFFIAGSIRFGGGMAGLVCEVDCLPSS
jgi:hypothetical protein